jgi:hypothetical protein
MKSAYEPYSLIDPFSLLVVNKKGMLKRIVCPFIVMCHTNHNDLVHSGYYKVEMVSSDSTNNDINYYINGLDYSHSFFEILL